MLYIYYYMTYQCNISALLHTVKERAINHSRYLIEESRYDVEFQLHKWWSFMKEQLRNLYRILFVNEIGSQLKHFIVFPFALIAVFNICLLHGTYNSLYYIQSMYQYKDFYWKQIHILTNPESPHRNHYIMNNTFWCWIVAICGVLYNSIHSTGQMFEGWLGLTPNSV